MSKFLFISILASVLLGIVQESLCVYPQYGRPPYPYFQRMAQNGASSEEESSDLIEALEELYEENKYQIMEIGTAIKQAVLEKIDEWEVDPETTKFIIEKIDETLSESQGRVGEIWRRIRNMITSGMASKLLRGIDLRQLFRNLLAKFDIDQLISYIPYSPNY